MKSDYSSNNMKIIEEKIEKEKSPNKKKRDNSESKKGKFSSNSLDLGNNDKSIEEIIDSIIAENNIPLTDLIDLQISPKYPFDGKLFSYLIEKENRTEKENYFLIHYLKFYDSFGDLLNKIYNKEEKIFLFNQIINKIGIEEKNVNDILFKIGDISEKFYFLLQGTAIRLNTVQYGASMNKFEFFLYMKYLYKLDENKLFNLILAENEEVFDKYELLYFILGDKSVKYSGDSLKQLKSMEASYVLNRIIPNKMLEMNYNNETKIVMTEASKTFDDIYKGDHVVSILEGHIKKINIPIKDYLENLKPIEFKEKNYELIKKKVILYTYNIEKEIKVGEHLEELDLKKMQKRNSTIICNSNCLLGYLIKKNYISCLKVTQTKFHKNDINFLLSHELFSMMNFIEFDKNYYHLFELEKMHQNKILFEQGESNNNIYFLKKGEIYITFEGSFNDIYRIIGLKGGPKNRKLLDINYIKRFHSINIDENIFKEKHFLTLFKIKENFPIGFDDFLDKENGNKILFKAFCVMDSEVFKISRENFNEILLKESEVRKMKRNYVNKRNNILIDGLNIKKNGLLQNYINDKFNIQLELPYLFDESPLLVKSQKRQKNFLIKPKRIKNELIKIETKLNNKFVNEMKKALRTKKNKENIEIQKYKYLKYEGNKSFQNLNDYIINSNSSNSILNKKSIFSSKKSIKIMNIKDNSKNSKINNEILELIKSENSDEIFTRKKNEKNPLDPYEKIYQSLKNDDKNRITDFSYLSILMPPHPNKQISKSKKNILTDKIYRNNFNEKLILRSDNFRNLSNKKEELKTLPSYMNIISKSKKTISGNTKLDFEDFQIKNFIFFNERLSKIFDKTNIKKNSNENNKSSSINENHLVFPKISSKKL